MSEAEDRIQLQDVMLSYAAAVDDRDMARYRACFMDDAEIVGCLLYTSPSPRDATLSRMPSSA